jgi:hypothetical protein
MSKSAIIEAVKTLDLAAAKALALNGADVFLKPWGSDSCNSTFT